MKIIGATVGTPLSPTVIKDKLNVTTSVARNLLYNSDFRNPVNQRGQTSYNVVQGTYTIDKWMPLNASAVMNTVELTESGITFGNANNELVYLTQRFEKGYIDKNKIYTTVTGFADGTISFGGYIDFSDERLDIVNFTFPANTTVKWVALYEGEYTLETLPEYQSKGYEQELLICRQYDPTTGEYIGLRKFGQPRNLLDNSDFRNPVNQRGESSYAGKIIGIDRWQGGAGTALVTVVDEGLKISYNEANGGTGTQPLMQYVNLSEGDAGKTVTFAARIKGGDVRIYFKGASLSYVNASDWTVIVYTGVIPANTEGFYVGLQGKNKSETLCEWMALYEGEYTAETLPEYHSKGYGAELAECQRYYQIIKNGVGSVRTNEDKILVTLPLCVSMRNAISVDSATIATVRASGLRIDNPTFEITAVAYNDYNSACVIELSGTFTGMANGIAYIDGRFHLSADIL